MNNKQCRKTNLSVGSNGRLLVNGVILQSNITLQHRPPTIYTTTR